LESLKSKLENNDNNSNDEKEIYSIYQTLLKHLKLYKYLALSQNKNLTNDEKIENHTKFQELIIEMETVVERINSLRFNINSDLQDKLVNETL
jgi:hypothetical protein